MSESKIKKTDKTKKRYIDNPPVYEVKINDLYGKIMIDYHKSITASSYFYNFGEKKVGFKMNFSCDVNSYKI